KVIDVGELLWVGLVGRHELAEGSISLLQINIDKRRLAAEADASPGGLRLDLSKQLACSLVAELHDGSTFAVECQQQSTMKLRIRGRWDMCIGGHCGGNCRLAR